MTLRLRNLALITALALPLALISCSGSSDSGRPENGETGALCESPSDCFFGISEEDLKGEAECLDRVDGGYCTHTCETDDDCCAAAGECSGDVAQVCAPFESTGMRLCFVSCESEDIQAAEQSWQEPPEDDNDFCQRGAGYAFACRSTGGGNANRKVCLPVDCGVGAACDDDTDCTGDLVCELGITGGYCTEPSACDGDADCPENTVCATLAGDKNVCLSTCSRDSDCATCRAGTPLGCTDDADLVESSGVSVCLP